MEETRRCIIITSPSGVDAEQAARRLTAHVTATGRVESVSAIKLEKFLKAVHLQYQPHDEAREKYELEGGFRYLIGKPQPYLQAIWPEAAIQAFDHAKDEAGDLLLLLHAVYYNLTSSDLFSCVRPDVLNAQAKAAGFKITAVATLIDDIYDVFHRLSRFGHIWNTERFEEALEDAAALNIQHLQTTLRWREAELHAAGWIATTLHCPHYLIALKHQTEAAAKWIFDGDTTSRVYLSHPISTPRKLWREHRDSPDDWTTFTEQVLEFSNLLAECETLAPLFPTTIDEKILDVDRQTDSEGKVKWVPIPKLVARWPYPEIGTLVDGEAPQHSSINVFDPEPELREGIEDEVQFIKKMRPLLRHFISQVDSQISSRDRWLVSQAGSLIVWRPYYQGETAGGVVAEIEQRNSLLAYRTLLPESNLQGSIISERPAYCFVINYPTDIRQVTEKRLETLLKTIREDLVDRRVSAGGTHVQEEREGQLRRDGRLREMLRSGRIVGRELRQLVDPAAALRVSDSPGIAERSPLAQFRGQETERALSQLWDQIAALVGLNAIEPLLHNVGTYDDIITMVWTPKEALNWVVDRLEERRSGSAQL
ncbi:MAG: hypothetical protein ACRD1R_10860 [Acidobacteriota bacterium]